MMNYAAVAWFGMMLLSVPLDARDQPASPATAPPGAPAAPPTQAELQESIHAIETADDRRLLSDRDYAAGIAAHLDRLARGLSGNPEAVLFIDNVRLLALIGLSRPEEAKALIDAMVARRPTDPNHYYGAWIAALSFGDTARALTVIETASRNVRGIGWPDLRRNLTRESVGYLFGKLHQDHDAAGRVRLANALFRIGYPGNDPDYSDGLRAILLDDRLKAGDRDAASGLAAAITTPAHLLPLLVQKRYDPLLPQDIDRLAALRQSLEARDRDTADALAAAPRDVNRLLDRAQHLRSVGRPADALAVLEPFTRDVAATVASDTEGMWLINEASYALLDLRRNDEAVALMARLAALPIAGNAGLIGPSINYSVVLWEAGRYREALAHATALDRVSSQYANDYGKMWIASSIVCALSRLDRGAESGPAMARLRAQAEVNPAALIRADVCLGDMDGAAAALVRRLQSDDPEAAVLALQDYTLGDDDAQLDPLHARYLALRQRPDVRAALDRVARVLALPLARTYWGDF